MTTTVYRITNSDNVGVYRALSQDYYIMSAQQILDVDYMIDVHSNMSTHPNGFCDNLPYDIKYSFGCTSIEKLKSWFDVFLILFEELKYQLRIYEVDESFVFNGDSNKQVVFDSSCAITITIKPISCLFET